MFKLKSSSDGFACHFILKDLLRFVVRCDDDSCWSDGLTSSFGFGYEGVVVCPILKVRS
jgi:hypothetical protein